MSERKDTDEVDVDAVMARVRERIGRAPAADSRLEVPPSLADPGPDLAALHATFDVQHPPLGSHRRVFGRAVLAVKRLLLRFLTPSLELQARHNAAATRLLSHFAARLESLERQVEALSGRAADPEDGAPP